MTNNKPETSQRGQKVGGHKKKKTARGSGGSGKGKKPGIPGLEARELAVKLLSDVLEDGRSFNEARVGALEISGALSNPDKGLARLICATVLRLKRVLDDIIDAHLERPLPGRYRAVRLILLSASAQLLILKTPPHAAINLAVEQTRLSPRVAHLASLVNAVLRKVAQNGPGLLAQTDVARRAIPDWLMARWVSAYGETTALEIARASLVEAPLDITVKSDAKAWAERLSGVVLACGSVRRRSGGRIEQLPGFEEGAWWVQDAAAALPARLLGDVNGASVVDLCAAPGGKSAQLAGGGAKVIAVDIDASRLEGLKANLARVHLSAEVVSADVLTWAPGKTFDFILVDAPCTSTGTIRRHPDILHLKRENDVGVLAKRQRKILDAAFALLAKGGTLVFCTCSLEPEEGEILVREFLLATPSASLRPITPGELGIKPEWLTGEGMLRTLPSFNPFVEDGRSTPEVGGGMDGFFAARIVRVG